MCNVMQQMWLQQQQPHHTGLPSYKFIQVVPVFSHSLLFSSQLTFPPHKDLLQQLVVEHQPIIAACNMWITLPTRPLRPNDNFFFQQLNLPFVSDKALCTSQNYPEDNLLLPCPVGTTSRYTRALPASERAPRRCGKAVPTSVCCTRHTTHAVTDARR